ncbi:MAG: ATP-binding protein [Ginsengibacter sp.]
MQKSLHTKELHPIWYARLRMAMVASIGLIVIGTTFNSTFFLISLVAKASLIGLVYLLFKEEIFKPAKPVFNAILPYIVISIFTLLIKYIIPELYKSWDTVLESLIGFSKAWGIGVWFVTWRQRKELVKTKEKMLDQEQKNQMMSALKNELEIKVAERTIELTQQKEELQATLENLQATQTQLIQSEKMASLGELTAGIAHEIQNPLNFVNNFSEVNKELLEELKSEIDKGNLDEARELATDIISNEEKIVHHGKRADAIVKGMLQHSRASNGVKEPTDVNALCDEYFRLAYHGLRAKDKSFNATMKVDFDESLSAGISGEGKIQIMQQDVGRVILNLLTNAFYAVHKKQKESQKNKGAESTGDTYEPTVIVTTKRYPENVEISVTDNGDGIPKEVLDKVFMPFFTTKPTGEGTGLGLSLSYDIITKGHGGQLRFITKNENQMYRSPNSFTNQHAALPDATAENLIDSGTTFVIILPIK